jgi:hypothetical protein
MPPIDSRRAISATRRMSPDIGSSLRVARSQSGTMMWFDTIVDSASAATITIEVAAENPPRNTSSASPSRPRPSGTVSTKRSGFVPASGSDRPTTAMGTTKRLMSSR